MNASRLTLSLLAWVGIGGGLFAPASRAETPPAPITAVACSFDGKDWVVGSQHGIEIRSRDGSSVVASLPTKLEHVHDLKFSPDGYTLLAAGGSPAEFGAVERWDWPTRSLTSTVREHEDLVYRVAWNAAGTQWATAGWDGVCHVHEAASGEKRATYLGHSRPLLAIEFLPDGETILSAGVDQTIQLWQAQTATAVRTLSNHVNTVNDIAVAPSANAGGLPLLASVSDDRTLRLWQPTIGRLVRFTKLESRPTTVAWLSQSQRLVVGCEDGTIRWFDATTLAQQGHDAVSQSPILSLAASPSGSDLIVGDAAGQLAQRTQ